MEVPSTSRRPPPPPGYTVAAVEVRLVNKGQVVEGSDDPLDDNPLNAVLLLARFRVHGRVWEAVFDIRKNRHYFRLRSRGQWSEY